MHNGLSLVSFKKGSGSDTVSLNWAGANNPLWISTTQERISVNSKKRDSEIKKNDRFLHQIKPDKQPIGYYEDQKPFSNHTFELNKDDMIYLFSDGYQDQFGGDKGKKLKVSSLREIILTYGDKSLAEQKQIL